MARVVLLPQAEQDIEEIWFAIATDNPSAADLLVRKLFTKFERLADFPGMGSRREELAAGIRILVEAPYLVAYRHEGAETVTIVRVLHGARDLPELL